MARIAQGIGMRERGERAEAATLFAALWDEIGADRGDPLHRCAVAHSMADAQPDVHDELRWDLRALEAADALTDERVASGGIAGPAAGFYPSLHLNLADCYRRLGDVRRAREHLQNGRATVELLGNDGYGRMIRGGLDRVADQLDLLGGGSP